MINFALSLHQKFQRSCNLEKNRRCLHTEFSSESSFQAQCSISFHGGVSGWQHQIFDSIFQTWWICFVLMWKGCFPVA